MKVWLRRGVLGVVAIAVILGLGYAVVVLRHGLAFRSDACRITPLMYHAVMPDSEVAARYWMHESEFARQMDDLRAAGAVTPSLDSVVAWLDRGGEGCPFPAKSVILTFDLDGDSRHLHRALPYLQRNGFQAVFFVPLMALDHPPGVSTAELQGIAAAGMTIGSHSEHHFDMRQEHPDSMVASLRRTRDRLGAITGQPILSVSAPGGRYNDRVIQGVRDAGFTSFFTSDPCYVRPRDTAAKLCRIEIRGDLGMTALEAVSRPWAVARQAADWGIKRRIESVVGGRVWMLLNFLRRRVEGPGY